MKRTSFCYILLIIAAITTSCTNIEADSPNDINGEKTINFCVANYLQYPMDDVTRSTTAENLDHLSMTIFDANGKVYQQIKQEKGNDGYGTYSLTLPYGNYSVVFFGYNGTREVEITSPTSIHFTDGFVPNCFSKALTLYVDKTTQATQNIVLERPVACFTLEFQQGTVPSTVSNITYTLEDCGTALNALTGLSSNNEVRRGSITINNTTERVNIYTFLPQAEYKATFSVTANDKNNKAIKTRTFRDVPLKINQRTYYNGNFFDDIEDPDQELEAGFSLRLANDAWEEVRLTY